MSESSPRLLIVSPHFPPVNAPDMQRVRMSLPHFAAAGWNVTVLTVDDPTPQAPLEPALLETVPAGIRVVRAKVFSRRWSARVGINNLGWRALAGLHRTARRLLRRERFDLVYFSTTQVMVLPLGRCWQHEFGVPYVIDLQDPWLSDYYERSGIAPPGGWKFRLAQATAKLLESWTLRRCAHVISVSPAYLAALQQRYRWFSSTRGSVLTFGAPDEDFAIARTHRRGSPLLPQEGDLRIGYAGRLGADMHSALNVLFAAVARLRSRGTTVKVFFFGTSYAPAGQGEPATHQLAHAHGISELIHEQPARIGYLDSLQLLLETDVALLLGSDDASYSPSKTYPTLIAERPTLALMPAASVLQRLLQELGGAFSVPFEAGSAEPAIARTADALARYAANRAWTPDQPANLAALRERHSARAVALAQLEIFRRIIAARPPSVPPV